MTNNEKINLILQYLTCNDHNENDRLYQLLEQAKTSNSYIEELTTPVATIEKRVLDIFSELGIPDHIKGHEYGVCAIRLAVENPKLLDSITGKLYPAVAEELDTFTKRIDSALRHAIDVMFDRGDEKAIRKYFENTINPATGKVSNGEFIARITNIVRRGL
jgi:two-component system response regulator (stage 0 sporulation protein A)